jgi:hypothetical protein
MITAPADTLMRQAPMTVSLYLSEAIEAIDGKFGDGYAAKNPQLVAAFIAACAQDFHTAMSCKTTEESGQITRIERVIVHPEDRDE